jgi:hypothetical protein
MAFQIAAHNSPGARLEPRQLKNQTYSINPAEPFKGLQGLPSRVTAKARNAASLDLRLFDNKAQIKVLTSSVSMHLEDPIRNDLFKQIDELLDLDAWDDTDAFIRESSFLTLLRFIAAKANIHRPALSVSPDGNIMASWLKENIRLTVEFQPVDSIKLVVHRTSEDRGRESLAFAGSLRTIDSVLAAFEAVEVYRGAA